MKVKNIVISKNARYFILGEPGRHIRQTWFVCHGYGQLAELFLREFKILDNGNHLVVAPEGLNRFYLHGGSGKVGASWMTSEDRLKEIEDYINYLDQVHAEIMNQGENNSEIINVLGFSQGTATASRWALQGKSRVHRLILWGGDIPPDTDWEAARGRLKTVKVQLVYGEADPYIKPELLAQQKEMLEKNNADYEIKTFNGHHEIQPAMLLELADTK